MDIPKPMAPVLGKPLLERTLEMLRDQGISNIVLLVHHRAEVVEKHFGNGSRMGLEIQHIREREPRGTGGALVDAREFLEREFLVLYGDTLVEMDFSRMIRFHRQRKAALTLFVHPNDHPQDSDLVELDEEGKVVALHPYPHPAGAEFPNLVNAALYAMDRALLDGEWPAGAFDIAKNMVPVWLGHGRRIFGYRGDGYIKDMGTPERLAKVERDVQNGTTRRKSGRDPRMAVFLDRDGTLNVEKGHLRRVEDLELFPEVAGAVKRLNQAGVPAIVVTNQPVIARGEADFSDVEAIHRRLQGLLAERGAYVDSICLCPHHPDRGFPEERSELKVGCACRKPGTGMIEEAARRYHLDLEHSWMVGDSARDTECARRAGMKSVLVARGGGEGPEADFYVTDLAAAVERILEASGLSPAGLPTSLTAR
jgi:histidinol-phosphate phosphatase family protein